jgi:hypothetical protein
VQPGLVRLGTIDTGLEVIAAAGNDFQLPSSRSTDPARSCHAGRRVP